MEIYAGFYFGDSSLLHLIISQYYLVFWLMVLAKNENL